MAEVRVWDDINEQEGHDLQVTVVLYLPPEHNNFVTQKLIKKIFKLKLPNLL